MNDLDKQITEIEQKIRLDKKKIEIDNIKVVGEYAATIKLYREISATVKILVKL